MNEEKIKVYVIPDEMSGYDEYYAARNEKELKELFAEASGFDVDGPALEELVFNELSIEEAFRTKNDVYSVYQIIEAGQIGYIGYVK